MNVVFKLAASIWFKEECHKYMIERRMIERRMPLVYDLKKNATGIR